MQKIDNVRASYNKPRIDTDNSNTKKTTEGFKNVFKKLITVKNTAVSYLISTKAQYIKTVKQMIKALKSVQRYKSSGTAKASQEDDNVVLLSYTPLADPHEQFEQESAEQLAKMKKDFHSGVKDEKYQEQVLDATFAAIYLDVRMSFEKHCFYNNSVAFSAGRSPIPEDYLRDIGQAASEWGVACFEKNGISVPKGAGANPLLNSVLSTLQKKYPQETKIQENIDRMKSGITAMVQEYCVDNGLKTPLAFKSILMEITQRWQQNINSDNSSDA